MSATITDQWLKWCPSCKTELDLESPGDYQCPKCQHIFYWYPVPEAAQPSGSPQTIATVTPAAATLPNPSKALAQATASLGSKFTAEQDYGWFSFLQLFGVPITISGLVVAGIGLMATLGVMNAPGEKTGLGAIGAGIVTIISGVLWGLLGLLLLRMANRIRTTHHCETCGNEVCETSKLCPTCRAQL